MKKWMMLALSLAFVKLQGDPIQEHVQSIVSITSEKNNEYLVEMRIEKMIDDQSQVIANPKLMCILGEPAELKIGTKEDSDFLFINAMISETGTEKNMHTSILMKENGQIVLSSDQIINIK